MNEIKKQMTKELFGFHSSSGWLRMAQNTVTSENRQLRGCLSKQPNSLCCNLQQGTMVALAVTSLPQRTMAT
jgi:hypothetical protein